MPQDEKVFAFDVGKASLGICAREGNHILELQSLLIPAEFAATADFRSRRRAYRTRQAHYKREAWLREKWQEAGLTVLTNDDPRIKREFPKKGDETLYNSALLRIALLQDKPLEEWQIFKALWSAIQRRGYDNNCDWDASKDESADADEKENQESVQKYEADLYYAVNSQEAFLFPCYLEASLMGLWHYEKPYEWQSRITYQAGKVRTKGRVAPRKLVEKEIRQLVENAKKQLPALQNLDVNEFLYGPGKRAYASQYPEYAQHRGTEWDAQGVLSQKVPRFDNRIISKCQMLPKRNVCKAKEPLHYEFVLLSKLKNLRFTDEDGVYNRGLTPEELAKAYEKAKEMLDGKKADELTYNQVAKDVLGYATGMKVQLLNMKAGDKLKVNTSGRSRFCRPALKLMNAVLLSGINPPEFDVSSFVQPDTVPNAITKAELEQMLFRLGDTWEQFSVQDSRYTDLEASQAGKAEEGIQRLIGSVNNPVVRHRLTIFWNQLRKLETQFGIPDKVILEFPRGGEGLEGQKTAADWEKTIKANEKANDELRKKLVEHGLKPSQNNLLRIRLLQEQSGCCPYTGQRLAESELADYDIDHIVPVEPSSQELSTDSIYNKVLCIREANRDKGNRTPYEWLQEHHPEQWLELVERVTGKNSLYGSRKRQLLTRADARTLVDNYNGLAETAYVARLAQQIVALHFGWGLQTKDDKRHIFVNDGKVTAKIRQIYGLNELLLSDEERQKLAEAKDAGKQREVWKKNRENPKHHALDAYCISYSQQLKVREIEPDGRVRWHVPGLELSKAELERRLIELFPNNIRRNTKELYPLETIYGYRQRVENGKTLHYLTVRKSLVEVVGKDRKKIKNIFDAVIRDDLAKHSESISEDKQWIEFLTQYRHPKRQSKVKTVVLVETVSETAPTTDENGRLVFGEFKDFGNFDSKAGEKGITKGQFKHSKQHKGQMIYFDKKGKPKVWPVYAHQSLETVKSEISGQGLKLYQDGMLFYSGASIFIPKPFKGGLSEHPPDRYKLRTIIYTGSLKVENSSGREINSHINYLVQAGFTLAEAYSQSQPETPVVTE